MLKKKGIITSLMKLELRFCESNNRFNTTVFGTNLLRNGETVEGI